MSTSPASSVFASSQMAATLAAHKSHGACEVLVATAIWHAVKMASMWRNRRLILAGDDWTIKHYRPAIFSFIPGLWVLRSSSTSYGHGSCHAIQPCASLSKLHKRSGCKPSVLQRLSITASNSINRRAPSTRWLIPTVFRHPM